MSWLGREPALDDTFNFYKALPGLALQNDMRFRDMYVHEKLAHNVLYLELEGIKELGGNAGGNNYNRLQAKNSEVVVQKLSISRSYLLEMEKTLLKILGMQSVYSRRGSKEDQLANKNEYENSFKPGLYSATYASEEYEKKHNKSCMWPSDRTIKAEKPYCGYVWSHSGNFYLERCPGDIHPFGEGHAKAAGVKTVKEIFTFKSVQKCEKAPVCSSGCFKKCLKKNQFNPRRTEELVDGKCNELADPLFPADMQKKTLTEEFLFSAKGFSPWYSDFEENDRDFKDVAVEVERYYLMTGEYSDEDCKRGKRKFLLEILDAVKQLISLEANLKEFYETSSACNIKLAKKFEETAMEGIKHKVTDPEGKNKGSYGALTAISKKGPKKKRVFTDIEKKEMNSSTFHLTNAEEKIMLRDMIEHGYKFTNDHIGFICKRSKKKDFCGGK